eukprot:GFUD01043294.1.p1 GENE.GFUD01043294.1~~GFUD01043294.1.p1  ORF type:complete len:559 (-),score=124.15 GFUD01043294.1:7-1683(-)
MSTFWSDYFRDAECATNCKIITKGGEFKETHKIILAANSDFLKTLLLDVAEVEESYICLPDFSLDELEQCLEEIFAPRDESLKTDLSYFLGLSKLFKFDEPSVNIEIESDKKTIKLIEEPTIKIEENEVEIDENNGCLEDDDFEPVSSELNSRPFKCNMCPKTFAALRRLKHHKTCTHEKMKTDIRKHYNSLDGGLYECKLCKKVLNQLSKFKKHMKRSHALGAKYKCDNCKRPFVYMEDLDKHEQTCEENLASAATKKYECAKCGKKLSKPRVSHKCVKIIVGDNDVIFSANGAVPNINDNVNTFVKLDSEVTGDEWSVKDEASENSNNVVILPQEVDESNYLPCEYCDQKSKSLNMLRAHITIRHPEKSEQLKYIIEMDGVFQCSICMKKFKRRSKCNYHVKIFHKIGATLECDVCKKPFYYEYDMNLHMKSHNETKEAYCDLCGKGFSGKHVLKTHMISAHTSKQEKESSRSHFCSFCAKGFFSNAAMKEHELLHGEAKNFHCTQCPKSFKQSSGLRSHVKRWHSESGAPFLNEAQKARMAAYMVKYRADKKAKK